MSCGETVYYSIYTRGTANFTPRKGTTTLLNLIMPLGSRTGEKSSVSAHVIILRCKNVLVHSTLSGHVATY